MRYGLQSLHLPVTPLPPLQPAAADLPAILLMTLGHPLVQLVVYINSDYDCDLYYVYV